MSNRGRWGNFDYLRQSEITRNPVQIFDCKERQLNSHLKIDLRTGVDSSYTRQTMK